MRKSAVNYYYSLLSFDNIRKVLWSSVQDIEYYDRHEIILVEICKRCVR